MKKINTKHEKLFKIILKIPKDLLKFIIYMKWIFRYLLKGNWNLGTEMAYWEHSIKYDKLKTWGIPIFNADLMISLNALEDSFGKENKPYNVLEIGPGPRSYLSEGYQKNWFSLNAIDPLANEFKKHLGGEEFLIQGTCEELKEIYPCNRFHMTCARNALDHVNDPYRCLNNIVNATMIKGIIFIQGNIKEGSRLKWAGLHKHDIWVEEDKLMCAKKDKEAIDLTKGLPIELYYYHEYDAVVPLFTIMYKKTC